MTFHNNKYKVQYWEDHLKWVILYDGSIVGEFSFIKASKRIWARDFWIDGDHQRKGVGTEIIKKAIEVYGAVFFYIGDRMELNNKNSCDYDSRYLTNEGRMFVESCVDKGVIRNEWLVSKAS